MHSIFPYKRNIHTYRYVTYYTTIFLIVILFFTPVAYTFALDADVPTQTTSSSIGDQNMVAAPVFPIVEVLPEVSAMQFSADNAKNDLNNPLDTSATLEKLPADPVLPKTDTTDTTNTKNPVDMSPQSLTTSTDAPTAYNPTFTYQSISPKVEKTTGALVENIPIVVPKGRKGIQPDIALTYNNQDFEDHIVGYGWNINIPYIERINRTGTEKLYMETYFTSSLSGELASTTTFNQYKPKVEETDSLVYTFATTTTGGNWIVYDKNGIKYTFGSTTNSHMDDAGDATHVFRWMLEEIRDTHNNFVRFEYYKDAGQIYPYKIYYTGSGTTDGIFQVEFTRESRPDIVTSYKTAFLVQTNYRISQIQSKVNGTWVHQYALGYTTGANTKRSLLQSVTESGQDESGSGSISLPAVTFEYVNDPISFTDYTSSIMDKNSGQFWVTADTDGNGLLDQNVSYLNSFVGSNFTYVGLNFNEGNINQYSNQHYYDENWSTQDSGINGFHSNENGVRYFDINGDGFSDVLRSQYSYLNSSGIQRIYWNDGLFASSSVLSWTPVTMGTSTFPYFSNVSVSGVSTLGILGNLNGDGLVDYDMAHPVTGGPETANGAYLGNGNGFTASTTFFAPKANIPSVGNLDTSASQLIDINGDGLDDWVYNVSTTTKVCLNNGTSWASNCDNGFTIATTTVDSYGYDKGIRFMDLNGDGLPDFVRAYDMPVYTGVYSGAGSPEISTVNMVMFNTGSGWLTSTTTVPGYIVTGHVISSQFTGEFYYNEMWDWSGDGLADWYKKKNASHKPDMIKKITYSTGGTTDVSYTPTTSQYYDNSTKHKNLPMTVYTVTGITNNDANGNIESISYSYENGDLYFGGPYDRKFAGFESITETRPDAVTKSYYYQGNIASTTIGELTDDVARIGKVYREDVMDTSGNLFKRTFYNWDSISKSNNRNFISLTRTLEQSFDGNSSHRDRGMTYVYDTNTGNVIQKIDYGEVSGNTDGTFSDIGSDLASTTITYVASSTVNMFLPSVKTTMSQSLTKMKETRYYYDTLALGSVSKGNLTKQEDWKDSTNYINIQNIYNSYGLVTQYTDPRSKNTTYAYDTYNLYVATSTPPISSLVTAYTYDYSSGQIKQTVDPNGRVFQNLYDGFDRLTERKQPDVTTPTSLVTKVQYTYTDNTVPTKVQETNYLNSATSTDRYSYFDGLGRKIQERTEAEGTNTYTVKDSVYGNAGKLIKESLPYFASSSPIASSTVTYTLFTNYTYDPLNRIKTLANAVGTTTNIYDDWHTTTTDALGNPKDFYRDANDNMTVVVEHVGGVHSTTTYAYDINKNLTSIIDGVSNVRNFTYNGLNRRLTAQDLHASGDGTFGVWTYVYDDGGNMTQAVDPKSQTVNYTYDDTNRPLTEDYTGVAGTEVTYTYDSGTDGKGRMTTASSTTAKIAYTYDPLGQTKTETQTIDGVGYITQYAYDRIGNLTSLVYPDNSEVKYIYNSAGLTEGIIQKENGGTFSNIVSNFDYSPTGKVTVKTFANGVQSRYAYNANALYRLTNITTIGSGGMGGSFEDLVFASSSETLLSSQSELPTSTVEIFVSPDVTATTTPDITETSTKTLEEKISESVEATTTDILTDSSTTTESSNVSLDVIEPIISEKDIKEDTLASDRAVNPYAESTDTYELTDPYNEVSVELLKDRPEIHLKKWGSKVDLGISYMPVQAQASRELLSNEVKWKEKQTEVHAYPVLGKTETDIGFEMEVVLNAKPGTHVFTFGITGAENLDFLYQPALNTEVFPHEADHCTETECFDENGKSIVERPTHIVGSYAVYYKNEVDGTGKVFHIYRPKATDATGKEVWGTLTYASSTLSVDIPEDFLKSAVYPVKVDPTFGYSTVGASQNYWTGYINATKFTTTATGTATSMSLRVNDAGSAGPAKVVMGIYNSNLNKIEQTSEGTISQNYDGWITLNLNNSVSLASSTDYWLAFRTEVGLYKKYDTGATNQTSLTYIGAYNPTLASSISSGSQTEKVSIYATYTASTTNTAPTAPTNLLTEGQTNPTNITDSMPEFSAIYTDTDTADVATSYQIQVSTTTAFTSTLWDSSKTALGSSTPKGTRIADVSYAGLGLTASTTYYWRIKFWDTADAVGAWSTATSTFTLSPSAGIFVESIQNISYTYDANGNITNLVDISDTGLARAVTYVYDSLNRLTSASTTSATSTPYKYAWTYDVLGNITSATVGTTTTNRTYAGTGYANPHAVTTIGSTTYTYDNNGNTTSAGALAYMWNYRNTLTDAKNSSGVGTTTYQYDYKNARTKMTTGGITTLSPNKYYQVTGATTTRYIFDPSNTLIATMEPIGTATTTESTVYTDSQQNGWTQNWSWSSNTSFNSTYTVYSGSASIANTYTGSYGGFFIDRTTPLDRSPYTDIRFAVNVGTTTSMSLALELYDQYDHRIGTTNLSSYFPGGTPSSNTWYDLSVPLSTFATSSPYIKGIAITNTTSLGTIYIDTIRFATDTGTTTSMTTAYIHPDHLGSTNEVTDTNGALLQSLDYYPYGSTRISTQTGTTNITRQYIGERFDSTDGLQYLNARYYDGGRGQFLSEDPVFWEIGLTQDGKKALLDPQQQNSYSYAGGNPITNKDPNGRQASVAIQTGLVAGPSLAYLGPVGWAVGVFGASFAAGYYGTQYILNNSQRLVETVQPTNYAELGFPGKGSDPNDFKDPKGGMSFWQKVIYTGLGIGVGAEAYHEIMEKMFKNDNSSNNSVPTSSQLKTFSGYNNLNTTQKSQLISPQVQSSQSPSVVSQNGIIYVRNSSGLLNFADSSRTK